MKMNRKEAVGVIKQLFEKCNNIEGKSIKLMAPDANNVLSRGCQIHVTTNHDESLESCVRKIVQKNCLGVHIEGTVLIVYKPQLKVAQTLN